MNRAALLASLVAVLAVTAGTAAPAATADATGPPATVVPTTEPRSPIDDRTGGNVTPDDDPGGAPADGTTDGDALPHDRASRLTLGSDPDAFGYATPAADLAATLAMGHAEFRQELAALTVRRRLSLAGSDSARRAIVRARLDAIQEKLRSLRAAERRAVRAYASGETSVRELARTLARTRTVALRIDVTLAVLGTRTDDSAIQGRIAALRARTATFSGPVRRYLHRAITARDPTVPQVSIAVTEDGYVLGVIADGEYRREALRYDNRDPTGTPTLTTISDSVDRAVELYPESDREDVSFDAFVLYTAGAQFVQTEIEYPYGTARTYIDAVTAEVFYEERRVDLSGVPTHEAINATNGSLRLVVARTFDNGPTKVRVVNETTGEPVDAVVLIGGERVGRTGEDGLLWVVEPPGSYAVVADRGNETVAGTIPDSDPA